MEKSGKPPIGCKHSLKGLNSENIPSPASTAIVQRGLHKDHPILGLIKNPLIRSSIKLNLSKDESYHSQDQVLEALCNFSPTLYETTFGTRSPLSPTNQNVCPKSDRTRTPIKAAQVGNFLTPTRFHSRSDKSSWPIPRRVQQKSRCQLSERDGDSSQTGQLTPSTPSPLIDEMRNNRLARRSVDEVVNQPITSPVVATTSDFADDFEVDIGTDPEDLVDSDLDSVDERDHPTKQVQSSFVTINPPVSRAIRVFVPSDLDLGFAKPKPKTTLVCGASSAPSIVAKSGDCGETSAASEPISSSDTSTLDVPDPSQVLRATRSRQPPNTSLPKAATTDKASNPIRHPALATLNNDKTDTSDRQSKKNENNRKVCTMPTDPTCPQKRDVSKHTKQNSKSSDVCGEEPSFKVPSQPKKRKHNSSSKSIVDATSSSLPIGEIRENKTRYLVNWLPRLKGSKLVVIGDMLDFNTPVPDANGYPWITSKIVDRVSAKVVSTKSSDYVLEGMLNPCLRIGEQPDSMPPLFIMHKFKHGFPQDWRVLLDHWRKVDADRKLNEENSSLLWSSAIAGNASFLSKSGGKNYGIESNLSSMSSSSSISHLRRNNFRPVANSSLLPTVVRDAAVDSMSSMHHESTFQSEIATARPAERRARSRGVRVNKNSTASTDGSDRRLEQGNSVAYAGDGSIDMSAGTNPQLQRTLSKQDFSLLRAKNYDNFSIVNNKKVYKCAFCNFVSPLFNNLKLHVKKNHVEGKNTKQALQLDPKKTNLIGKGGKTGEDESQSVFLSVSDHRKKSNYVSPSKKETVHATTMPIRGRPRLRKEAEHTHSEAPERNLELTISQQNLEAMRAKKYESFTVVDKRKIYNCNFCDFTVKLFNDLKYHVRKNHLHSDGRRKTKAKQYVSYSNPRARSDESQLNSETLHCSESRRRNSASPLKSIPNQVTFSTTTTGEHIHNRKTAAAQTAHHNTNSQQHRTLEQTISKQDFSELRAKKYTHYKIVDNKKSYYCCFCTFEDKLFAKLRSHIASSHVDITRRKNSKVLIEPLPSRARSDESLLQSTGKSIRSSDSASRERRALSEEKTGKVKKSSSVGRSKKRTEDRSTMRDKNENKSISKENHYSRRPQLDQTDKSSSNEQLLDDFWERANRYDCKHCPGKQNFPTFTAARKHLTTNKHQKYKSNANALATQQNCDENQEQQYQRPISRYGRKIKHSTLMDTNTWTGLSPKSRSKTKSRKATNIDKLSSSITKPKSSVKNNTKKSLKERKVVKNPFIKNAFQEDNADNKETSVGIITANPRTLKERLKNDEIFEKLNQSHEDDLFQNRKPSYDLMGNEDDSDGSEISVHSARTPVEKYMKVARDADKTPVAVTAAHSPEKRKNYQTQAYVHNMIKEKTKKPASVKRKLSTAIKAVSKNNKQKKMEESCRIIETAHLASQSHNDEDTDQENNEEEDWMLNDDTEFGNRTTGCSLLYALQREELI